jgi:hypothetical protein
VADYIITLTDEQDSAVIKDALDKSVEEILLEWLMPSLVDSVARQTKLDNDAILEAVKASPEILASVRAKLLPPIGKLVVG